MCCLTTILLVFIPRIGIVYWWVTNPQSHDLPFASWVLPGLPALPAWLWTLLGGIFLPWTTLAYLFLFPGGIVGYEWLVLGIALLVDLAGHGGTYRHRNRLSRQRS
ncbi:MAG: hypothetical protein M1281_15965 [Chloroflexi bacterium]|nr:hypothetical protein [Chloroflexota bacterium]